MTLKILGSNRKKTQTAVQTAETFFQGVTESRLLNFSDDASLAEGRRPAVYLNDICHCVIGIGLVQLWTCTVLLLALIKSHAGCVGPRGLFGKTMFFERIFLVRWEREVRVKGCAINL